MTTISPLSCNNEKVKIFEACEAECLPAWAHFAMTLSDESPDFREDSTRPGLRMALDAGPSPHRQRDQCLPTLGFSHGPDRVFLLNNAVHKIECESDAALAGTTSDVSIYWSLRLRRKGHVRIHLIVTKVSVCGVVQRLFLCPRQPLWVGYVACEKSDG